jgi:hypothetical protein
MASHRETHAETTTGRTCCSKDSDLHRADRSRVGEKLLPIGKFLQPPVRRGVRRRLSFGTPQLEEPWDFSKDDDCSSPVF